MVSAQELIAIAQYVPDSIPQDKPSRVMIIKGGKAIPCGGTHVTNIEQIEQVHIDKIKNKEGNIRVSYSISPA